MYFYFLKKYTFLFTPLLLVPLMDNYKKPNVFSPVKGAPAKFTEHRQVLSCTLFCNAGAWRAEV